jgi:hypothetical protein
VTLHRAGDDFEKDCKEKAQMDLNTELPPQCRLFRCGGIYYFSKIDQLEASDRPAIETLVPAPIFNLAWEQLTSGNVTHADLSVYAEVFQERLESKLAEPWHHQGLLIERDSSDHPVEFQLLQAHSHPVAPKQQDWEEPE